MSLRLTSQELDAHRRFLSIARSIESSIRYAEAAAMARLEMEVEENFGSRSRQLLGWRSELSAMIAERLGISPEELATRYTVNDETGDLIPEPVEAPAELEAEKPGPRPAAQPKPAPRIATRKKKRRA